MSHHSLTSHDLDGAKITPRSLLDAVNSASGSARNNWLFYLALLAYLIIAAASVSHKDLLLNSPLHLPILDIAIPIDRFFLFAPLILLMIHFGLLVQHVLLSRKIMELDRVLREDESWRGKFTHPLRLELHSYFFTQVLAGTKRSKVFGLFLHIMVWLSLVIIPLFVILFFQITFLPYHDPKVTWAHRVYLVCDILVLAGVGIFLRRPEANFWQAFSQAGRYSRGNFIMTITAEAVALFIAFFMATIPGSWLDQKTEHIAAYFRKLPDKIIVENSLLNQNIIQPAKKYGLRWPRLAITRNLIVTDETITMDGQGDDNQHISLRNRDLRHATLNRSVFKNVDFSGSDLSNAQMIGADLTHARFGCSTIGRTIDPQSSDGIFAPATVERCAVLKGADLRRSILNHVTFARADLSLAKLEGAEAKRTNFSSSNLSLADFSALKAPGANFSNSKASFTSFLMARLKGVDFSGSQLVETDFTNSNVEGANFGFSKLYGSNFEAAQAGGVNFSFSRIKKSQFIDTDLKGSNLNNVKLFNSAAPAQPNITLASLDNISFAPLSQSEQNLLKKISGDHLSKEQRQKISRLLDEADDHWTTQKELWLKSQQNYQKIPKEDYRRRLTNYLGQLACHSPWELEGTILGLVSRAARGGFNGNIESFYQWVGKSGCDMLDKIDQANRTHFLAALNKQRKSNNQTTPLKNDPAVPTSRKPGRNKNQQNNQHEGPGFLTGTPKRR